MENTALENKLNALKIPGRIVKTSQNEFYSLYHIAFNDDITLNKIRARRDDLSLFLGGHVDIETDAGKVVLKVEKKDRGPVSVNDFSHDIAKGITGREIPLIIGLNENGERIYYDLVKMPHLLVAGSTGSGKSVFMHNCILSTFYTGVNLVMIDVKKVEFSIYEDIPHLMAPICYDSQTALNTLKNLCYEMDNRYQILKDNGCRNIKEYKDGGGKMNYICVFIDELADLMLYSHDIELYITRLAQLGRAAGIHLIVATQRPDATIISGLIRVNIPSRVCFAVQKATDSRIILDATGGENLRGMGDGLFLPIGSKKPLHFQAPYITSKQLELVAEKARNVNNK